MAKERKHHRNPFASRDLKIQQLEYELQGLRDREQIKTFAEDLCSSIGTILANLPYAQWPALCKTAFEHEKRRAPAAARLYLKLLSMNE